MPLGLILNSTTNGSNKLFLTLFSEGAFGSATQWIISSIQRALDLYKYVDLDVSIVSYHSSNQYVRKLVDRY